MIILAIISSATTYQIYALTSNVSREIHCPKDDSLYIWTPIGTFSENFNWRCLACDITWTKTYSEDAYGRWRNAFLEPSFVRDYTLLYLITVPQMEFANPLTLNWTGGRETPDGIVGYETYIYSASGITITVDYPVVKPENTVYTIKIQIGDRTLWEGELHQREFITHSPIQNAIYDHYSGVGLFDRGIHIVATSYNPMIREATAGATNTSGIGNAYWLQLKENVTLKASTEDFISIIISRGDKPTGGYATQVKSFSWLESYPVKFRFNVDFIDPGEGVAVTEAFTNPLVLIPLGKLSTGEYTVEVHIDTYVLTFDEQGNPLYTLLQTLREETWKLTFTIE
jgi:hypothetical protein